MLDISILTLPPFFSWISPLFNCTSCCQSLDIALEGHDLSSPAICCAVLLGVAQILVGGLEWSCDINVPDRQSDFGMPVSSSDLRSQSSLSRDPNAQNWPTNSKVESLQPDSSELSLLSTVTSYSKNARGDTASPSVVSSNGFERHLKRRRLSWLPLSLSGAYRDDKHNAFVAIPPTISMSSVSSSSISSPMLTSTTNARVANAARIEHSDILFPVSSHSVFQSQRDLATEVEGIAIPVDNSSSWVPSARSYRAKVDHARRASTGVTLTSSLSRHKHDERQIAEGSSISRFRKGKIARYREKLHHLRERLHVLPIQPGNEVVVQPEDVKAKEIQSQELDKASRTSTPRVTSFLPKLHSDSTTDLFRGSLSRSFASAVDKLGLDSSPTLINDSPSMAPLRKTKSVMDLFGKYISSDKSRDENSDKGKSPHATLQSLLTYSKQRQVTPGLKTELRPLTQMRASRRNRLTTR